MISPTDVKKYYSFGKEISRELSNPTLDNDEFSFTEMVAYGCLALATISGHSLAACELSKICSNPKSRFYNIAGAKKLMEKAEEGMLKQVEEDYSLAFDAGCAYMYDSDGEDLEKAEICFRMGAQENASCVWMLGVIAKKQGRKEKAFNFFMEAANRGQGMAMYEVGQCFEKGEGTPANKIKAIEWYRRCVESKYAALFKAQERLRELTGE